MVDLVTGPSEFVARRPFGRAAGGDRPRAAGLLDLEQVFRRSDIKRR